MMSDQLENVEDLPKESSRITIENHIRRKRRRAFFWGAGLMLVLGMIGSAMFMNTSGYPPERDHIARVNVQNMIMTDPYLDEMLIEMQNRADIKALIIDIDSPGGEVYASESLYASLRVIAEKMPNVALMRSYAASGGYITALASDHIIAGETTLTGSIGVISEMVNVKEAADKLGVRAIVIRSSDVKGGMSPLRDPTPEEITDAQTQIASVNQWFQNLVAQRRGLSANELGMAATGEAFSGKKALELGLVDTIGYEANAIAYLGELQPDLLELEIVDWAPVYPMETLPSSFIDTALQSLATKVVENLGAKTPRMLAQ